MGAIPTVKVKSDNKIGYMTINETDFDRRIHEIYDPEKIIETVVKRGRKKLEVETDD